jgi:dolichol kinase
MVLEVVVVMMEMMYWIMMYRVIRVMVHWSMMTWYMLVMIRLRISLLSWLKEIFLIHGFSPFMSGLPHSMQRRNVWTLIMNKWALLKIIYECEC